VLPDSEEGQNFAKVFWTAMLEFTGGDMNLMFKLSELTEKTIRLDERWDEKHEAAHQYMHQAINSYFGIENFAPQSDAMVHLMNEASRLQAEGVPPESKKGQEFAKVFWDKLMEITGGDIELLEKLNNQVMQLESSAENKNTDFLSAHRFMQSTLEVYFSNQSEETGGLAT
jgi:hypothetical protein